MACFSSIIELLWKCAVNSSFHQRIRGFSLAHDQMLRTTWSFHSYCTDGAKWMMPLPQPPNGNRLRWSHSEKDLALQAIIWLRLDDHQLWSAPKSCILSNFNLTTAKKNMIFSQKLEKLEFLLPFRPVYAGLPSGETSVLKESMPNDRKGFEMLPVSPTSPKTDPSARHKYSFSLQDWKTPSKNILQHSAL